MTSAPLIGTNTNNELVAEININAHAARTYGHLKFVTNTTHKAVLVTVIGLDGKGACQALLCLTKWNQKKYVKVVGLNPFKYIDFLMDGMYPVTDEIYQALDDQRDLFGDDENHRIRDAIFPLIFRRYGQQTMNEWRKGFYYYQPIQQVSWIRFKCLNKAKDIPQRGFIPAEVSYFIGDDGIVIIHKVTEGLYSD